jgi:exopolyphosphatase/guanosine-5'-triphosphate,3'-diphosphate pyrophosphatase
MKLAIIDCGTNTFNLLIVELHNQSYTKLFNTRSAVKLGEGAINKGYIDVIPFNRGLQALTQFKTHLITHNVVKTLAYATSAIRTAKNGVDFITTVKHKLNLEVTIIDGNREAELIYLGNKEAVGFNNNVVLIMDIGGGSTEFILANKTQVFWKQSFLLGAARLLEKFTISNPITQNEIAELTNYLKLELEPLFNAIKLFHTTELIGSSGAFDSIIEMIHGELNGEPLVKEKVCYDINMLDFNAVCDLVVKSTINERKNIKGLIPMRFDMIVVSSLLINFIIKSFSINKLKVSTYSLKEGALVEFMNT